MKALWVGTRGRDQYIYIYFFLLSHTSLFSSFVDACSIFFLPQCLKFHCYNWVNIGKTFPAMMLCKKQPQNSMVYKHFPLAHGSLGRLGSARFGKDGSWF